MVLRVIGSHARRAVLEVGQVYLSFGLVEVGRAQTLSLQIVERHNSGAKHVFRVDDQVFAWAGARVPLVSSLEALLPPEGGGPLSILEAAVY